MNKTVQCGFRISMEESRILQKIKEEKGLNRLSDVLRYLIAREYGSRTLEMEQKMELILQEIESQFKAHETEIELIRFIAILLTAFVRKNSKSDPNAGEQMVLRAQEESKNQKITINLKKGASL